MARVPLSGVYLTGELKERIRLAGTAYVYQGGTTTAATVYAGETGTGTLTAPIDYLPSRDYLRGWVEPGEYTINQGGVSQTVDASAGDNFTSGPLGFDPLQDQELGCFNYSWRDINTLAAATTSGTARFMRVVPRSRITAGKVVSMSGSTAVATITATKVGLYTTDGTTLTRVAVSTTNLTSGLWDTTNTRYAQAFSAGVVLQPGQVYYVGLLVVATTAGTFQGFAKTANVVNPTSADVPVPMYTLAGQTDLDATEAISGLTAAYDALPYVGLIA
jgi:hypothetical protein